MSGNPLAAKVASPYARALFDFSVEQNIMHQITADFQNLEIFLDETKDLIEYLNNPLISSKEKKEILTKTLESQLNKDTFKFINVLVDRNRINLLQPIIVGYLELIYQTASIQTIEVNTAFAFTNLQRDKLIKKLKEIMNAREIRLVINVDSSLIGGFLIKTNSKVLDFTVKNQLQKLAKHLDGVLEI